MRVALIGTGRMGLGIGARLLHHGHELTVYNRTRAKAEPLRADGATIADSIAAACDGAEIAISMLADDGALAEVVSGAAGVRAGLGAGTVHVAMGTHGIAAVRETAAIHAAAGQRFLAAPVLGRPDLATRGELKVIVGGEPATAEACAPLLELVGSRLFSAGPRPEDAALMKIANNFVLAAAIETMGEAFALVSRHGADERALLEVLVDGLFSAPAYHVYGRIIVEREFDRVGVTARLGLKDIELARAAGAERELTLPTGELLRERLTAAIERGDGERDWSVVARDVDAEAADDGTGTRT